MLCFGIAKLVYRLKLPVIKKLQTHLEVSMCLTYQKASKRQKEEARTVLPTGAWKTAGKPSTVLTSVKPLIGVLEDMRIALHRTGHLMSSGKHSKHDHFVDAADAVLTGIGIERTDRKDNSGDQEIVDVGVCADMCAPPDESCGMQIEEWDDMSGEGLDPRLVEAGCKEEVEAFTSMGVYE